MKSTLCYIASAIAFALSMVLCFIHWINGGTAQPLITVLTWLSLGTCWIFYLIACRLN